MIIYMRQICCNGYSRREMDAVTGFQILNLAVCIWKVSLMGSLTLVWQPVLAEISEFKR